MHILGDKGNKGHHGDTGRVGEPGADGPRGPPGEYNSTVDRLNCSYQSLGRNILLLMLHTIILLYTSTTSTLQYFKKSICDLGI